MHQSIDDKGDKEYDLLQKARFHMETLPKALEGSVSKDPADANPALLYYSRGASADAASGKGRLAFSKIVVYETPECIKVAKARYTMLKQLLSQVVDYHDNVQFTEDISSQAPFDTALLTYYLTLQGHTPQIVDDAVQEIKDALKPGGKLIVIDYNLQGKSLDEINRMTLTNSERAYVQSVGIEGAVQNITRWDLKTWQKKAAQQGLQEIKHFTEYAFFIWVGRKKA